MVAGSRVYHSSDEWLRELLRNVKQVVKECYGGRIIWRDIPIFLANTREGRRAYLREIGTLPVISQLDSEYGSIESINGKHFIFLNSILVDNFCEGDACSTIIHEILHILHPNDSEEEIRRMERDILEHLDVQPDDTFEN